MCLACAIPSTTCPSSAILHIIGIESIFPIPLYFLQKYVSWFFACNNDEWLLVRNYKNCESLRVTINWVLFGEANNINGQNDQIQGIFWD